MPPEPQFTSPNSPDGAHQGKPIIKPPVFIVTLIILAGLLGSFEIYKLYISPQNTESDSSNQTATLDTSTDSTSLTSTWKAYRNDEYGFEFKYPPDWKRRLDITGQVPNWISDMMIFKVSTTQDYPDPAFPLDALIHMTELENLQNKSLQDLFNEKDENCEKEEKAYLDAGNIGTMGCPGAESVANWQKFNIDGKSVLRSGRRSVPEGLPTDHVYIQLDKKFLVISATYYNLAYSELDQIFNQILSTFKFISTSTGSGQVSFPILPEEKRPRGQFCGGIAAIRCPQGQLCKLGGSYPDAGGYCE